MDQSPNTNKADRALIFWGTVFVLGVVGYWFVESKKSQMQGHAALPVLFFLLLCVVAGILLARLWQSLK